ncbi:22956_t:CDS:1, partial [Rhizophagus irregularis]
MVVKATGESFFRSWCIILRSLDAELLSEMSNGAVSQNTKMLIFDISLNILAS